jgi:hypothetical protein
MTDRTARAATRYRLSAETWAEAVAAYQAGATADEVAERWMTSPRSVERHAARAGGKRAGGDQRARAHARAVDREERAERRLRAVALEGLFDWSAGGANRALYDPKALMKQALGASGRAMRGRLWVEAKVLAGLAETYGRLARAGRAGTTATGTDGADEEGPFGPRWTPEEEEAARDDIHRKLIGLGEALKLETGLETGIEAAHEAALPGGVTTDG